MAMHAAWAFATCTARRDKMPRRGRGCRLCGTGLRRHGGGAGLAADDTAMSKGDARRRAWSVVGALAPSRNEEYLLVHGEGREGSERADGLEREPAGDGA